MADFIGSNWFGSTVWKCVSGVWSELTPALPGGVSEARAVWGTYAGDVWRHNGDGTTAAIQQYVNTLGIDEDVIRAELIERSMSVTGMYNIDVSAPSEDRVILENQIARIQSSNINIS